jgi:WbqC-like protein family
LILAAHQPQFAPWLGFFDKLDRADVFVLLDNVQFKKNEWQNRNRIKGSGGPQWLTVPVSGRFGQTIEELDIAQREIWPARHLKSLRTCYSRAPYFAETIARYERIVCRSWEKLGALNIHLLFDLLAQMSLAQKRVLIASELDPLPENRDERLIELCRKCGAETYLAGSGGRDYMGLERYQAAGLEVVFQEYRHPSYPQLFGTFTPHLSVLDLLFNCGPDSMEIIRSGRAAWSEEGRR